MTYFSFGSDSENFDLVPLESGTLPSNVGTYLVYAQYQGDDYPAASSVAILNIVKPRAVLTIDTFTTTYGDNVDLNQVTYSSEKLSQEELAAILATLKCEGDDYSGVCEHAMSVTVPEFIKEQYSEVAVQVGNHIIAPKEITIVVENAAKNAGESDPEFTYRLEGKLVDHDMLGKVTLSREVGEKPGTYAISATVDDMPNYDVNVIEGELTINALPIVDGEDVDSESSDDGKGKNTVKTGDSSNLLLCGISLVLSLVVMVVACYSLRRQMYKSL